MNDFPELINENSDDLDADELGLFAGRIITPLQRQVISRLSIDLNRLDNIRVQLDQFLNDELDRPTLRDLGSIIKNLRDLQDLERDLVLLPTRWTAPRAEKSQGFTDVSGTIPTVGLSGFIPE